MSRLRMFDIAAIALVIACIGGLTFVLRPHETPTASVAPSVATVVRPQPPANTPPSVLFIGDSYTAGLGMPEMSYSCRAAVEMGWLCNLSAVPGTGYISGGPANRFIVDPYIGPSSSFAERIPKLAVTYQPDIVVLDGGRNDFFPPREDVLKAMAATLGDVRRAWPTAMIVFVRPRFLARPEDDLGFNNDFMSRLITESGVDGVVVMDPVSQFVGTDTLSLLSNDGIHPHVRGEQRLANALVDSFRSHGFTVAP